MKKFMKLALAVALAWPVVIVFEVSSDSDAFAQPRRDWAKPRPSRDRNPTTACDAARRNFIAEQIRQGASDRLAEAQALGLFGTCRGGYRAK